MYTQSLVSKSDLWTNALIACLDKIRFPCIKWGRIFWFETEVSTHQRAVVTSPPQQTEVSPRDHFYLFELTKQLSSPCAAIAGSCLAIFILFSVLCLLFSDTQHQQVQPNRYQKFVERKELRDVQTALYWAIGSSVLFVILKMWSCVHKRDQVSNASSWQAGFEYTKYGFRFPPGTTLRKGEQPTRRGIKTVSDPKIFLQLRKALSNFNRDVCTSPKACLAKHHILNDVKKKQKLLSHGSEGWHPKSRCHQCQAPLKPLKDPSLSLAAC